MGIEAKKGLNIALDLEGVLADSNTMLLVSIEEKYGVKAPRSFQYQWNNMESAKNALGIQMSPEEHEALWLRTWELWDLIPTIAQERGYDEPAEMIHLIENSGHKVTVLTHSFNSKIEHLKQKWLDWNIPGVVVEWVNDARQKHEYEFDLFVDDSPHNLVQMKRANKLAICFEQPWNKGLSDDWYWHRVRSLLSVWRLLGAETWGSLH